MDQFPYEPGHDVVREIRRRLLEYCRGIDRCDAALVASVYHPDGTDDHGSFVGLGTDFAVYATDDAPRVMPWPRRT